MISPCCSYYGIRPRLKISYHVKTYSAVLSLQPSRSRCAPYCSFKSGFSPTHVKKGHPRMSKNATVESDVWPLFTA